MDLQSGGALAVALAACVVDVRSRRIPNALTLGAAAGGVLFHGLTGGWTGLLTAAAGGLVGLAVFLPFFALRGMGGGDVKLMAAVGVWLGPLGALRAALGAMIVGGPMALALAWSRGYMRQAWTNVRSLVTFWRAAGFTPHPQVSLDVAGSPRLPFSLPIVVGVMVAIWLW